MPSIVWGSIDMALTKWTVDCSKPWFASIQGVPVGLDTSGASMSEESDTIELVYEPFLLQEGYLKRTPRGRIAMPRAYELLGVPLPARGLEQGSLGL